MKRVYRRKSTNSHNKCKYKRCLHKRTLPIDRPRYCVEHVDKLLYPPLEKPNKPLLKKVINFFYVED